MTISRIGGMIQIIRDRQVIIDEDLAVLYGVKTKHMNEAVRHNLNRFPEDFMFQLTREETRLLRSRFSTLETSGRGRFRKYWPLAFTEQGVAMLSSVLRSERAVRVNIEIMRTFVRLRRAMASGRGLETRMRDAETAIRSHDHELDEHAAHLNEAFAAIRRLGAG